MALQPGARLGPYEIQAAIGAGSMGEVYRALDTRLARTVAIKVLPPDLAADPSFRERFDREARAISQLDHPHICALHDVGEQDGASFLVMQYLEGETLAARLAKGPLSLDDVLRYSIEIADALDKAHRHGVVHRDLKPGNIILTKAGSKLLDFGLAKVGQPLAPALSGSARPGATALPTMPGDGDPLTMQGTILGTLQYMSPEQLEGRDADARTDLFAFGAIVYEMATGRPAFEGKSQVGLIAAIIDHDPPPISSIQPVSPPLLDHLVKTCLAKNADQRWQTAADVLIELKLILEIGERTAAPGQAGADKRASRVAWSAAAVLLVVTGVLAAAMLSRQTTPEAARVDFEIDLPATSAQFHIALSPDGKHLASIANRDRGNLLWLRTMDRLKPQFLTGTEGAQFPFWSPDSRFIAFFAAGKLKRVDIFGAPPQTVCEAPEGRGGTWNRDGVILLAPSDNGPIARVAAAGGATVPATELDRSRQEIAHRHPYFLPDGRHFVYTAVSSKAENSAIYLGALDSHERKRLANSMAKAVFAPPDHLLFIRDNSAMAQRFDSRRLELVGDPFAIADDVGSNPSNGAAGFTVADVGVLAYRRGAIIDRHLFWYDRSGRQTGTIGAAASYRSPAVSPDLGRLAVSREEGNAGDIWIFDLARGTETRFTFDPVPDKSPVWSPNGTEIAYVSNRNGTPDLYRKNSGGGQEQLLLKSDHPKVPDDWSSDGRFLLYRDLDPRTGWDLWLLPLDGKPQVVVQTPFTDYQGRLSPDGHWIAYVTNESGIEQVYVQPLPATGSKWQISTIGGYHPRWRRDGKELFFISGSREVMAAEASVSADGTFRAGVPRKLFAANPAVLTTDRSSWDVAPDGQRFLINSGSSSAVMPIVVVLNWNTTSSASPSSTGK